MKKLKASLISVLTCICIAVSLTRILPINAHAVTDSTIVYAAMEIIVSAEGNYGSINANDNGALSIGKVQWHATRALDLLKMIIAKNPTNALSILGQSLYDEISGATSWETRALNTSESSVISQLLTTPEGIEAQDELAYNDILTYVNNAKALGITDPSTIVYFCDLNNQHGLTGAKRVAASAYSAAGSYSAITPAILHSAALADSTAGKYPTRRQNVYNYVTALDWETIETDIDIGVPYKRPTSAVSASSSANDIKWLQTALNILGPYSLSVNGSFDNATQNALISFEQSSHLFANGSASISEISYFAELLYIKANPKCASFYTVTTNGGNLNLRQSASTTATILAKIPNNTVIEVFSISGTWAYARYNGIMGYCSSEWITFNSENSLVSLSVKSYPKTFYNFGEPFDLSRLILKATYKSGDYEYITQGFTYQGTTSAIGTGYLTITYKSLQVSIEIDVADEVASIEICGTPKTQYTFGDEISAENMYIKVNYQGGGSEYIYSGFEISADTTAVGTQNATVTYCGAVAEYTITVSDKLESISVVSPPKKTMYYDTEKFDSTGLVLKADYASGTSKYITSGYRAFDMFTGYGYNPVYITYDGVQTKISIFIAICGDVNLSARLDSYDALHILQSSSGLVTLSDEQTFAADMNLDGQVDSLDALCVLYHETFS